MSGTWTKKMAVAVPAMALLLSGFGLLAAAQEPNPTTVAPGAKTGEVIAQGPNGVYIYHVKVVERQLDAVNYFNRSGSTHVGFRRYEPDAWCAGRCQGEFGDGQDRDLGALRRPDRQQMVLARSI